MEILNKRDWRVLSSSSEIIHSLLEETGCSETVMRLLHNRGIDNAEKIKRFFNASLGECYNPFLMKGMVAAVEKLRSALREKKKILIFGDFDVDGLTGTAILYRAFSQICPGYIFTHIPDRMLEGYGLKEHIFTFAKENGIELVVTVDCGISNAKEARVAKEQGIDLIITDHHHPPEELPDAYSIINPKQNGCMYPFKDLSGVGIAMKLLHGIFAEKPPNFSMNSLYLPLPESLWEHLDLVALGTVADIVPLLDENRIFVKHGLEVLTASHKAGIQALKKVAGVDCKKIDSFTVGFRLAPMINAAGRVGNVKRGLSLLITESKEEATTLAHELEEENRNRKTIESRILDEAKAMYLLEREKESGKNIIVLASDKWHPGVIGIVAARLVDEFFLPTIVIAFKDGEGHGSGRSIPNFHMCENISQCKELLIAFGGHEYAAGLTIKEENLSAFKKKMESLAEKRLTSKDLRRNINIDGEISLEEFSLEDMKKINCMAPFGEGNKEPVFCSRNLQVMRSPTVVGKNHLRMQVKEKVQVVDVIGFQMGEYREALSDGNTKVDIVFVPQINCWKDRKKLQLKMKDIKASW